MLGNSLVLSTHRSDGHHSNNHFKQMYHSMSIMLNELIKLANDSAAGETRTILLNEIVARSAHERQMERLRNRGVLARVYDFFLAGLSRSVVNARTIESAPTFLSPAPVPMCSLTDRIEDVSLSSVELLIGTTQSFYIGNGVAISPHLILTALHRVGKLGQKIIVIDREGVKRDGTVDFIPIPKT